MQEYQTDSLSSRLPSLLPEYLKEESPALESFLKAYFEFLEAEIITLSSQSTLDNLSLEDGVGDLILEDGTVSNRFSDESRNIVTEQSITNTEKTASPFIKGEYVVGSKSKSVGKITLVTTDKLYVQTIEGHGFQKEETITGRESLQTAVVESFKQNTVLATNKLLDYSDVDRTTEEFLQYFQNDLIPSLDIGNTVNRRLTIKNIKDLYQSKGTAESVKFLMRLLYGEDATIRYPDNETQYISESGYNEIRRLRVVVDTGLPSATDRIIQYTPNSKFVEAEAIIENVFVDNFDAKEYALEITINHSGTFTQGSVVTFIDRDGITEYTGTVLGIINQVSRESSSTYVSHDDNGVILLEGEDEGGLLFEQQGLGSLYTKNDIIEFTGSKSNHTALNARGAVDGLTRGGITKIYIDAEGTGYEGEDLIVFDNVGTSGGGAEAVIGSVGDEVMLEGGTAYGHFTITATQGQTLFGGAGVTDDNGMAIFFNDADLVVFKNDIRQTPNTTYTTHDYTHRNDRVVFTAGLNAGDRVDLYTEFNRLTYEDNTNNGDTIVLETTIGNVRSVRIKSGGSGYEQVPACWPGGYIYFNDLSGFEVGETVTGGTTGATSTILRIEEDRNRLVVKRLPTDTGGYQNGETIIGGTTSTSRVNVETQVTRGEGARLFAYSDDIGGITSINLIEQGSHFYSDGILSDTSFFPMLISSPSAVPQQNVVIEGQVSGSTATIVKYDATRHILVYKNLSGCFADNETVAFNNVDTFKILKTNPYNGIGKFAGEGNMQEQFVTDKGQLNTSANHLQDSLYYQTHSYVIKVAESINKYRSVVKDLLHPAGHIFFGEVGLEKSVTGISPTSKFVPTIILVMKPVLYVPDAFSNSLRTYLLHADMSSTGPEGGVGLLTLDEAGQPVSNTDPRTGGGITEPRTEYGDSSHRSRHMNILKIVNKSVPSVRVDNVRGVVRSVGSVNLMDNQITLDYHNRKFVAADQGKIQSLHVHSEEKLIMEDGCYIEFEEDACLMRAEEQLGAIVKGEFGSTFISEDGEFNIRLESATTDEEKTFFVSEATIDFDDKYTLTEDGLRLVMEDGSPITDEESSENSITTYIPFGPTFKTINTMSGQQTYRISYYIKDEEDDGILMEDGYGTMLNEDSIPEGLRISDLDFVYPKMFMPKFKTNERKRIDLSYSAYVKSA